MGMDIENPEAHALAREIAARTGLSLTDAVLVALREKRAALAGEGSERRRSVCSPMAAACGRSPPRAAPAPATSTTRTPRRDAAPAGRPLCEASILLGQDCGWCLLVAP